MTNEDYVLYSEEILNHPNTPHYMSNAGLAKDLFQEMSARLPSFVVTLHVFPSGQAICITVRSRKRLSKELKTLLFKLQNDIDAYKAAIDEIEDAF